MKRKFWIFLFLFIFFLFSFRANGLGIGPTDNEIEFKPNLIYELIIYVINSENYNFPIKMSAEGDLADYIKFDVDEFVLGPKGTPSGVKYVKVTLSLPEKLERPGKYRTFIYATQNVKPTHTSGIGSILRIGTSLTVYVPYPGKYVEFLSINIENPQVNKTIRFLADTINRGNQTIENAKATFYIYDADNNLVATFFDSEAKEMPPSEKVQFIGEWFANNVKPGKYRVVVKITYDDYRQEESKEFMIGSPTAKIINITTSDFTFEPSTGKITGRIIEGSIEKIKAKVASEWNERMKDLYLVLEISKGDFKTTVKSETFDLDKWEEKDVQVFWDTANSVGAGKYTANAVLYYPNGTHKVNFDIELLPKETRYIPFFIVGFVVFIVILLVFVIRRKGKHKAVQKKLF